ncbi:hypothetical protein BJ166DRAFT_113068 [Pestalotiopsis sp. NC0098]|nr:hypothetical protein BJ166DRAFT_113068 [Pestalotiopsis sp. NC0098]
MLSLFEIVSKRFTHIHRSVTDAPEQCFQICSDAKAQTAAWDHLPKWMCNDSVPFHEYYKECAVCMVTYTDNSTATDYLTSNFGDDLDACNFTYAAETTLSTTGTTFIWNPTSTASTFTTITSASMTITASPTTATNDDLAPTSESTATPESNSSIRTWIAGPIVGSIVGVALLAFIMFLFYRRRNSRRHRTTDDYIDKPQLHSELLKSPQPSELDTGMRHELPGSEFEHKNLLMTQLGEDSGAQDKKSGIQRPLSELPG